MLFEVPLSFYTPDVNQNIISSKNIELTLYNNHKGCWKNEVMLDKNLFLFVREGHKTISVWNETLALNTGHGAILVKGSYLMSEITNEHSGNFSSLMIFVDNDLLLELWEQAKRMIEKADTNEPHRFSSSWICFKQTPYINVSLEALSLFLENKDEIPHTLLINKLQEVLIYLAQSPDYQKIAQLISQIKTGDKDKKLKDFMEKSFTENWTIEQFAYNYGFSTSTFKRIFGNAYDATPKSWITNRRLEQAAMVLKRKKTPLLNLALSLGFSDNAQFSKAFRRKYGCPPSAYK